MVTAGCKYCRRFTIFNGFDQMLMKANVRGALSILGVAPSRHGSHRQSARPRLEFQ